jgi:hypothetical protein
MGLGRIQQIHSNLPNLTVVIKDSQGVPARLYGDSLGRILLSENGITRTTSLG